MTERDCVSKMAQADRLLNDLDIPLDAALVWRLTEEISRAIREVVDIDPPECVDA